MILVRDNSLPEVSIVQIDKEAKSDGRYSKKEKWQHMPQLLANEIAKQLGLKTYTGNVVCNDRIYRDETYKSKLWQQYGILASEMEGTALYTAAAEFGARALMTIGVILNITVDEEGVEHFTDAPENDPPRTVDDLISLAIMTAAAAE